MQDLRPDAGGYSKGEEGGGRNVEALEKALAESRERERALRESFTASENLRREAGEQVVRAGIAFNRERERAEAAEAALKALREDCARWGVNIEWAVDHISGRVASVGDQRDGADTIVRQCLAELRARSTATPTTGETEGAK